MKTIVDIKKLAQPFWFMACVAWLAIVLIPLAKMCLPNPDFNKFFICTTIVMSGVSFFFGIVFHPATIQVFLVSFIIQWIVILMVGRLYIRLLSSMSTAIKCAVPAIFLLFLATTGLFNFILMTGIMRE